MWAVHLSLAMLFAVALLKSFVAERARRKGASKADVVRGETSVTALYVLYGFATVALTLTVQVATSAEGHKAGIILFDYGVLTYLFFFNSWFRNQVVFRLLGRIRQD
jgi:hypothetical protein